MRTKREPLPGMTRVCTLECGKEKPLEDFPVDAKKPLGRAYGCRACREKYYRKRRTREETRQRGPEANTGPSVVLPAMDLVQQLACIRFRKWKGPVTPVDNNRPLRATIGGGYV